MLNLINFLSKGRNDDLFNVCRFLLKSKKLRFSNLNLKNLISNHVDYPSILAIHDTLLEYGIESLELAKGDYSYNDFEFPFICAIQKDDWSNSAFTIVTKVGIDKVHYLDPVENTLTMTSVESFQLMDIGLIMLIDTSNAVDEKKLKQNLVEDQKQKILSGAPLLLIIISLISCSAYIMSHYIQDQSWISLIFLTTFFSGVVITLVLISHEIDKDNKVLNQVCGIGGKNVNCTTVLASNHALGFGVSWSVWGGTYFGALFLIQLLFANSLSYLKVTASLSLMVVPFIFYSIYVQWRIVKQWCLLCLAIQFLLVINALMSIVVFTQLFATHQVYVFQIYPYIITFIIGASLLTITLVSLPLLKLAQDSQVLERKLRILKSDKDVFVYFLNKGDSIKFLPRTMGITLGNPSAADEIVIVCNPYCRYCALLHQQLNKFTKGDIDITVRMLFLVSAIQSDLDRRVVSYFFEINEKHGANVVESAMNYWYSNLTSDLESLVKQFVINSELDKHEDKIEAMNDWIRSMKISVTPTLFFNGYKVPFLYQLDDIIDILKTNN